MNSKLGKKKKKCCFNEKSNIMGGFWRSREKKWHRESIFVQIRSIFGGSLVVAVLEVFTKNTGLNCGKAHLVGELCESNQWG